MKSAEGLLPPLVKVVHYQDFETQNEAISFRESILRSRSTRQRGADWRFRSLCRNVITAFFIEPRASRKVSRTPYPLSFASKTRAHFITRSLRALHLQTPDSRSFLQRGSSPRCSETSDRLLLFSLVILSASRF